ncbi:hypothetical protein QX204_34315 (plasmid) [Nocardia sp. PE-7]|uniref:hypothetical protein n=1 Tax=Nocardia sp. PE-7 TaxID=3058426 RepID=UPI00265838D2|nr:hypothetical protein [Nocardia sp. PE-7]WKG13562.1 hypothetical protein QX204_34315 [Nocardia sp. PE-7]
MQRQVHALNRVGTHTGRDRRPRSVGAPSYPSPPVRSGFRWWWIPLGLVVFVALVILI